MNNKILISFRYLNVENGEIFVIRGSLFLKDGDYVTENLSVTYNGNPYKETRCNWNGNKFTAEDILFSAITSYVLNSSCIEILYVSDDMRQLFDKYIEDYEVIAGKKIPRKMVYNVYSGLQVCDLALVTNLYTYYYYEDTYIMIDTETNEIVADNYFAEFGLFDSLESESETILYKGDF